MVIGSLAVKSYRVDRIFRNTMPGYKFSDFRALMHIIGIVAVEAGLMLVSSFFFAVLYVNGVRFS